MLYRDFGKKTIVRLFAFGVISFLLCLATGQIAQAQTFIPVDGWSAVVNQRIAAFLNSTKVITERKVAVFDCDGTLFGQVPYYLADEALYAYGKATYEGKTDPLSKRKMEIVNRLIHEDNTSEQYVQDRIDFLSGMTTEAVERMGVDCYHAKYQQKIYPQMRSLLANLKAYGFEIWVLSASPELLYQGFIHSALGIPKNHILGVKSVVRSDTVTGTLVLPVPQDAGKAEAVETFIKARPLFVGGNSRGDMEMMNTSVGLKLIVNPDNKKVEKGTAGGDMAGHTVYGYWSSQENTVIVSCEDLPGQADQGQMAPDAFTTGHLGIKQNSPHKAAEY